MTTTEKTTPKPFLITLKDKPNEKLDELRLEMGLSRSGVIAMAIDLLHEKKLNNYVTAMKERKPREVLSPEEKADRDAKGEVALKERKLQILIEAGSERAKLLGASIEVLPNGSQMATWKVYAKETPRYVSVGELGKNITEITDLDVSSQYRGGTREELEAILNAS
jgi:hypothetical protein